MRRIFYNGNIVTMEEGRIVEAVCIENGRIMKTGNCDDIMAFKNTDTECTDLNGKTMLPGFIDSHSHFSGVAHSLMMADLSKACSLHDVVEMMRAFLTEHPVHPGEWLVGTNYDHNFLKEQRHPNRHVLDEISTEIPVVVIHVSSHMGAANSAALRELGISAQTKDPQGGRYKRDQKTGEPDGYMEENAFLAFRNRMPQPDIKTMIQTFQEAQKIYASYGITTMQEGLVTAPLMELLKYLSGEKMLYLDLIGYISLKDAHSLSAGNEEYIGRYRNRFKVGGYKIFLDGSPQGKTAWVTEPYEGTKEYGCQVLSDDEVYRFIQSALSEEMQLLAHCNGDAAAEQYITQFERVLQDTPKRNRRPVMIHAQMVRKEQLKRMAALHMIPSFFAAHTYYWGDVHIRNLGLKRASSISPLKDAKELELCYTLHQDSPVIAPDMMQTVWCAVSRITRNGATLGEQERISVYDALKAVTANAAYQYFEEDDKGTVSEGKLADLIILDKDPLTVKTEELAGIKVLETIKEGNTIYRRKESGVDFR